MIQVYTYYKHQIATGTGIETNFNKDVSSTEADDIKKRIKKLKY